jgi:hypothetical protein
MKESNRILLADRILKDKAILSTVRTTYSRHCNPQGIPLHTTVQIELVVDLSFQESQELLRECNRLESADLGYSIQVEGKAE